MFPERPDTGEELVQDAAIAETMANLEDLHREQATVLRASAQEKGARLRTATKQNEKRILKETIEACLTSAADMIKTGESTAEEARELLEKIQDLNLEDDKLEGEALGHKLNIQKITDESRGETFSGTIDGNELSKDDAARIYKQYSRLFSKRDEVYKQVDANIERKSSNLRKGKTKDAVSEVLEL